MRRRWIGWCAYVVVTTWLLAVHVPAQSAVTATATIDPNYFDWTTIDTAQTYDGLSDDGTFYYGMTVKPDLSSTYDVLTSDGVYLTQSWQARVVNGNTTTQNGTFTDSAGNKTDMVHTEDSVSGDVANSSSTTLPSSGTHAWSVTWRGDGSTRSDDASNGSTNVTEIDPPSTSSIAGHFRNSPANGSAYQSDMTYNADGSYSGVTVSDGVTREYTGNADGSGSVVAKDAIGNVIGTMNWGIDGAAISVSGIYAQ